MTVEPVGPQERDTEDPVALWIDLHRVRGGTVRCRAHLLGLGDAGADVEPPKSFMELLTATSAESFTELVERRWGDGTADDELPVATRFGLALGDVLFPEPVKELLDVAVSMLRPVEIRLRAHDRLDGIPWELARFQLQSFENLTLNTVRREGSPWIAMLRQVDARVAAVHDPDVVAAAIVRLGPSQGVAEDVRTAARLLEGQGHDTRVIEALGIRSLDVSLPATGAPSTAVRAAMVYVHGHLGGQATERMIQLQGGWLSYQSLEDRLRIARTRIAVLNVCETADRMGDKASWIERLCATGTVEAAIGLRGRIDRFDESRHFAGPVISVLARGGSIGDAVHHARTSFPRPEMIVAATAQHHPVSLVPSRRAPRTPARSRQSARGVAPLPVTMATAADGALVIATQATLTVDVSYAVSGRRVSDRGPTLAYQLAARVAAHFGVEAPDEVIVVKPDHKPGFDSMWEPSLAAAVVNAVAGLTAPVGATERAQAVQAIDGRWAANDPAIRRMVDDRSFPMRIAADGRVDAAQLHADLDLIVVDRKVVPPCLGTGLDTLGALSGLDRIDSQELAALLRRAVAGWLKCFNDPSFGLVCEWYGGAGLVTVTVLPSGHLAGVVRRGGGDAAVATLGALAGSPRIRCEQLPLATR